MMAEIVGWSPQLSRLQDLLTYLFPSETDGRILCNEAGMAVDRIDFRDPAYTRWFHILDQATKQQRVQKLVNAASIRYSENTDLVEAIQAWEKTRPSASGAKPDPIQAPEPIEDLVSLTYLLRSMRKDMAAMEERLRDTEEKWRALSALIMSAGRESIQKEEK